MASVCQLRGSTGVLGRVCQWMCVIRLTDAYSITSGDGTPIPDVITHHSPNKARLSNVGSILAQRCRRWANIEPTLDESLVLLGC